MAHLAGFGRPNTAVGCLVVTLAPVCQRPALDEKSRSFAVVGFLAGGGFGRPSWATTAHGPALCPRRVGLASLATPHAPLGAPGTRPPTSPIGPAKQAHFGPPPGRAFDFGPAGGMTTNAAKPVHRPHGSLGRLWPAQHGRGVLGGHFGTRVSAAGINSGEITLMCGGETSRRQRLWEAPVGHHGP